MRLLIKTNSAIGCLKKAQVKSVGGVFKEASRFNLLRPLYKSKSQKTRTNWPQNKFLIFSYYEQKGILPKALNTFVSKIYKSHLI